MDTLEQKYTQVLLESAIRNILSDLNRSITQFLFDNPDTNANKLQEYVANQLLPIQYSNIELDDIRFMIYPGPLNIGGGFGRPNPESPLRLIILISAPLNFFNDRKNFATFYEEFSAVMRHELAHFAQYARKNFNPDGIPTLADPIKNLDKFLDYILNEYEMEAYITEAKYRSRKKGRNFATEMKRILSSMFKLDELHNSGLSFPEKDKIIKAFNNTYNTYMERYNAKN